MARSSKQSRSGGPFFVDLFAGCGGCSLGLELAGFTPAYVNELDLEPRWTYLANRLEAFDHLAVFNSSDIRTELGTNDQVDDLADGLKRHLGTDAKAGQLDLVIGGPPCQGYSGIGHRRSYAVDKTDLPSNYLYQDMVRVIEGLAPKIFLFENVRGLLAARWTPGGKRIWPDVWDAFQSITTTVRGKPQRYVIQHEVVYAKDYGVPQNRPRLLMVGVREDLAPAVPDHQASSGKQDAIATGLLPAGHPSAAPSLEDLLSDLVDPAYTPGQAATTIYPGDPQTAIQEQLRTDRDGHMAGGGAPLSDHEYSNHRARIVEKFQYMLDHDGAIPAGMQTKKFAQRVLPRQWSDRGPTITATSLPDDYVHFEQPRSLTVREMARLQTFPDWYQFKGKRTTGGLRRAGNPRKGLHEREVPKYTQVGNAVPVSLAKAIGRHFRELLDR